MESMRLIHFDDTRIMNDDNPRQFLSLTMFIWPILVKDEVATKLPQDNSNYQQRPQDKVSLAHWHRNEGDNMRYPESPEL